MNCEAKTLSKGAGQISFVEKLKAAENVWWAMVVPVLNFGAEIWGATSFDQAEQLQLQAGKTLGISRKTTNEAVRGELGWWTMRSQRDLRMLVFWARIIQMDDSRFVKIVYKQRRAKIKRANDWCAQGGLNI